MRPFSAAAPRKTDAALFRNASPGLAKFQKQVRKELRQKGRVEYARAVLHNQESTQTGSGQQ